MNIHTWLYKAYGLTIMSALQLPELVPLVESTVDITIRLQAFEMPPLTSHDPGVAFFPDCRAAYFRWEQVGNFLVQNGNEIIINPESGASEALIRQPLLGTVLAFLLHQRAHFVFHASAVATADGAIAFLGEKGYGKSTLAAAFYKNGYPLVADDIVALDGYGWQKPTVIPGFPQIKLWPDSSEPSLGQKPEELPVLVDGFEKRARIVKDHFEPNKLPLRRIYVLGKGDSICIRQLQPQTAFTHLLAHTYVASYGPGIFTKSAAINHLQQIKWIFDYTRIKIIERPNDLLLLESTINAIEEDLRV